MAKFILMFSDTIDKGVEASFDIVGQEEGTEDTAAIVLGRQLLTEITNAWTFRGASDAGEKSEEPKKPIKGGLQGTVS